MVFVSGNAPLHFAVKSSNLEFITFLLIANKADLNVANNDGSIPLEVAIGEGNAAGVELLMRSNAMIPGGAIVTAAFRGFKHTFRLF